MMEISPQDAALLARIADARVKTMAWLSGLKFGDTDALLFNEDHDATQWPGMLLPGTYNGIMCLSLLNGLEDWSPTRREALANWINGFRQGQGAFRIPGLRDDNIYKKPDLAATWQYIDFHVSNYSLGALEALGAPHPAPDFARPFLDPITLKAWLSERDMRDPWQEGNNIVNLASFLLLIREEGGEDAERVNEAMQIMFDWHDRLQEPATGFWGLGQGFDETALLHAMAGSMHNYHLYYTEGRTLPYQDRAADYILGRAPVWTTACIDVDEIDLLIHAAPHLPERAAEIDSWLRQKLAALLNMQDSAGGFADTMDEPWRQDGWVGGYSVAPGTPTTFATWFRWIAIAMIVDHLWPHQFPWQFRRMIGIGYRQVRP